MPSIPQFSQLRRSLLSNNESTGGRNGRQNVTWVEGVRGVASFFVVVTHLCRAWNYTLWYPRDSEDASPQFLQLPFVRLPWQGRIGVTMFSFLTGYVCAIKPLRQVKSGNTPAALTTLAKSVFRRPPRLVLPSSIAICFAWFFAQLGGFVVANRCDSEWLRISTPRNIGDLPSEIYRLFHNLQKNWVDGHNEYDDHQWAIKPLLEGAFMVYLTLFATIYMKAKYRILSVAALWLWFWCDYSGFVETFQAQFIFGVLLCDIGSEPWFRDLCAQYVKARRIIAISCLVGGCYVACYPTERPEWAEWSRQLSYLGSFIFPPGTYYPRRWSAVGWDLMVTGIWLSPSLQAMFSNKLFRWIGRNSFAVYLTHGTVLKVFAVRFVYGWTGKGFRIDHDEKGEEVFTYLPRGGRGSFMVAIPVFFVVQYTIAHLWTTYVDSFCARVTRGMENLMFEPEEEDKSVKQFA